MGLWNFLRRKILDSGGSIALNSDIFKDDEFQALLADYYVRELAFQSAVNLIGNCVSKCEFKTFLKHKETKGPEYYLFNIEPNRNQNSSAFLHKLIYQLFTTNECLVVEENGQLFVADSFTRTPYVLYDDIFQNVTIGDFSFTKAFAGSEVLYWKLHEKSVRELTNGIYESYSKLISYGVAGYKRSKGTRGTMSISTMAAGERDFEERMKKLVKKDLKEFFGAENAALPLFEGWKYDDLTDKSGASQTSRDIRALIDDMSDFTAKALSIAPALLRGDVSGLKDAMDFTLTFCVDPLCDMLSEEINRKRNGKNGFLAGNYMQINTKTIKHVDLFEVATAIDKLISCGPYSIDDIRIAAGDEPINEPWSKQHWMTKNYETVQALLAGAQGGGSNGK